MESSNTDIATTILPSSAPDEKENTQPPITKAPLSKSKTLLPKQTQPKSTKLPPASSTTLNKTKTIQKAPIKEEEKKQTTQSKPSTLPKRHNSFQDPKKKTLSLLKKLEEKKYQDNALKALEMKRFQESKIRLRNYVVYSQTGDDNSGEECDRLICYFKHRYNTFIAIMKEAVRSKRVKKTNDGSKNNGKLEDDEEEKVVKVFSLKPQNQQVKGEQNLNTEECAELMNKSIQQYLTDKGLPQDTHIFMVIGHYNDIRQEFLRRGWVEHEHPADGQKFTSNAFHFLYCTKSKDCYRISNLAPQQHLNHFEGTKALTTKVGLTHNMKNLIWKHNIDIDSFFPQSYDLSDLKGDEFKDFKEDFRYCQVIGFLKQVASFNKDTLTKMMDRIMIALNICEKRIQVCNRSIFDVKEFLDFETISDDIHYVMCDLKASANFGTQPWYRKLQKLYKELNDTNAKDQVKSMLERLKQLLGNQYSIIGKQNGWILKPGGKSRGRGITIHTKFENIVSAIEQSQDSIWVIQKYIENPLIIHNKKFDIRQWVVVTSWKPLKIWFFDECYLRFSADNYDGNRLHDKFMHLTNNCVASQSANFANSVIEGNMWHCSEFENHLTETFNDQTLYREKLQPQIKQGVIGSILAARDMVVQRENTHEMFGYDFMVDTNFNVWLIEVNSSPSMEHSTKVTEKLVVSILSEVPHLIYDCQNGEVFDQPDLKKCGKFELIYSE